MSINYKVVSKRPGGIAGENPPKYYPVLTNRNPVELREICAIIAERSTFSPADVVGVVQSLIELVPELLQDGRNVKLDGFGTFSIHASGKGKMNPEEVTQHDITNLKMSFLPNKQIKKQLQLTEFVKEGR